MFNNSRIITLGLLAILSCGNIHAAAQAEKPETFADFVNLKTGEIKNRIYMLPNPPDQGFQSPEYMQLGVLIGYMYEKTDGSKCLTEKFFPSCASIPATIRYVRTPANKIIVLPTK